MEESKYSIPNEGVIQGQVIGDNPTVHQHFYSPGSTIQKPEHIWRVPYQRNPFFTGREDLLQQIHEGFTTSTTTPIRPQAINGLGGIGKTQLALEYLYRYQSEYSVIVWLKADTPEILTADFFSLAHLLNLPEKVEADQARVIQAILLWLNTNSDWLLIFDNADELSIVRDFLPSAGTGHVLLTTRIQSARRVAQRIALDKLEREEAMLFLLRRATLLPADAPIERVTLEERARATEIANIMDGHPLALDQAGAYIEESACSLIDYLQAYRTHQAELLKRRGELTFDHKQPVATTFSLSFKKATRANPAAADLLKFFSFLHPDAIPEELLTEGAPFLGPLRSVVADQEKLNIAIGELAKYSLVSRNPATKTLTIHRLVQTVMKSEMNEDAQRRWALRAVQAVNKVFQDPEFERWERYWLYLPHAYECTALIEEWEIIAAEAIELLRRIGFYFQENVHYSEAEPFVKQALQTLYEENPNPNPLEVAAGFSHLASLYFDQGKYAEAEPLFQHALAIYEKVLGTQHPTTATALHWLAILCHRRARYAEAEALFQRALAISEELQGAEHLETVNILFGLASLYSDQGRYREAEPLYQEVLSIRERVLDPEHPDIASALNGLALIYREQGKYAEAEPLYQRALAIREQVLGAEHPDTAAGLHGLAALYHDQGKYAEAEPLFQHALIIREKALGLEHPDTATSLNNLATLYDIQGKYNQVEMLYKETLNICETVLGSKHFEVVKILNAFGYFYYDHDKFSEAETYYKRALEICEQTLGSEHPTTAFCLNNLATAYDVQSQYTEAEPLYRRALSIREKNLGPDHPDTVIVLENYADLLRKTKRKKQANELEAQYKSISYKKRP